MSRAQIADLDTLAERRRRLEAGKGKSSREYQGTDNDVASYKSKLTATHGADPALVLTGGRKSWRVSGEGVPDATDMVIAATEYAYGQRFRALA